MSECAIEPPRTYISSGRVPEGTKITAREACTLLGVSRVPAREALANTSYLVREKRRSKL